MGRIPFALGKNERVKQEDQRSSFEALPRERREERKEDEGGRLQLEEKPRVWMPRNLCWLDPIVNLTQPKIILKESLWEAWLVCRGLSWLP